MNRAMANPPVRETIGPCTLEGEGVRLVPMRPEHVDGLFEAGRSLDWAWMLGPLSTREAVARRVEEGLRREKLDSDYAFAVIRRHDQRIIGSTAYLNVVSKHRRVEIGSTWYARDQWGTAVNPECKLLLLAHAFEDWGAVRVQLGTDENNVHSQRAILKLGAKFEGVLRNHGIRPDGSVRNAYLYSIIDREWPSVKAGLLGRLGRNTSARPRP